MIDPTSTTCEANTNPMYQNAATQSVYQEATTKTHVKYWNTLSKMTLAKIVRSDVGQSLNPTGPYVCQEITINVNV